jgi:hypothetical protein
VLISILCFGLAILQWIFMHRQYFALKVPLHYIDWLSIVLFVATFMFSAYVFAFGKQQDWLNSKNIINASIGFCKFCAFGDQTDASEETLFIIQSVFKK